MRPEVPKPSMHVLRYLWRRHGRECRRCGGTARTADARGPIHAACKSLEAEGDVE